MSTQGDRKCDLNEVNVGKNKGKSTESLADSWAENMHEHTEGLDKLKDGMMPLKRSWEYTYFLFIEENPFIFLARRSLWNNNFPNMLHMTITVRCATFRNYLTSLCCSFVICKREMIIVPPLVGCINSS